MYQLFFISRKYKIDSLSPSLSESPLGGGVLKGDNLKGKQGKYNMLQKLLHNCVFTTQNLLH